MIKTIVVDDEAPARELMSSLLHRYFNNKFIIVAECANIQEAFTEIEMHQPDLVFLDIKMKNGSGFDLLKKFNKVNFEVIFTTAYSEFALEAIKQSALDYLLKPINPADLLSAVNRFEKKNQNKFELDRIRLLLENIEPGANDYRKIAFPSNDGYKLVKVNTIKYCVADINYTRIFFLDGNSFVVSKTMKRVEELLPNNLFIRTHKSYLVNVNIIKEYSNKEGHCLILANNEQIPISNRKKNEVLARIL
ncbi:MAG: LytR/AlgR family response regulator transcription factor [Lishizhenia sp.]